MTKEQLIDRLNAIYAYKKGVPNAKVSSQQVLAMLDLIYELATGQQEKLDSEPSLTGCKKYIIVSMDGEYLNRTSDNINDLTVAVVEEYAQILNTETQDIEHIFVEGKWQ